jgi:hypothetical protein
MSDNNNAAIGFKEAGEEGEADYKELVLHLKHDAELTYRCIKEIAQARELSQNPHLHKAFERLLADSKKSIQRLDSELKQLESSSGDSNSGKRRRRKESAAAVGKAVRLAREEGKSEEFLESLPLVKINLKY